MTADEDDHDYEQAVLATVEEHGWFCSVVFDPEGVEPSFAYSVGFTETLGCGEFIVFGLEPDLMHAMLWSVFRQIEEGRVPQDDQRWSDVLEGFECVSRAVHPTNIEREWLNSAIWFWGDPEERGGPVPAFQLVWPGAEDGLFPWDTNCSEVVRRLQPALYLPKQSLH